MIKNFITKMMEHKLFKPVWSATAITTVIVSSAMTGASALVAAGSVIGVCYVLGVAFGNRWANLFGALLGLIFGYLSFEQGFYGNAAINILYSFPLSVYGLWLWFHNSEDGQLTVKRSLSDSTRNTVLFGTFIALSASCAFSFLSGANMWYLDGLSAVLPILGTWFLVNMYKEQWYYWLTYNALEVIMWFYVASVAPEMLAILVMRVVFLVNSGFGYINWFWKK